MGRLGRWPIVLGGVAVAACSVDGTAATFTTSEEVVFTSEGEELSGTLWLPAGSGPHAAMVYVHGSGRQTRSFGRELADHFNPLGVGVLGYDKRGVGRSGGVYVGRNNGSEENLLLLARDAAAGVELLRGRREIDPARIGLWGVSQAGWIVPPAAVLDGGVAFTILVSGPTVTVGEEGYYSFLTGDGSGRRATWSQDEISRLLAERGPSGFDPQPFLRRLEAPGLWMLGTGDESIPIPETITILDQLIEGYDRPFEYRVWDRADHALRIGGRRVPDFWSAQDDFLLGSVGLWAQQSADR